MGIEIQKPAHEEHRSERMLLALSKALQTLQSARSPEEVYRKFGKAIHDLGFEATILSLDDSGKSLTTTFQTRAPEKMARFSKEIGVSISDYRVPIRKNGILDQVVKAGRTVFFESKTELFLEIFPRSIHSLIKPMVTKYGKDMRSIIAPLRFDKKTFGVMGVSGADLGEMEMAAITVFADQVSAAIMNAHAYSALQDREEEKFKLIFESAPDAYYLNDLKGEFIDGNKEAERLTGYRKDELIGKTFLKLNLLPKNQLPTAATLLAKNVLGRSTGPDEFTLIRKDGSEIVVEITTHPVNIEGKIIVLGIARDITERKRVKKTLQDSEERYRTIFESVNDSVVRLNNTGKIIDINDRVTKIFGYTRDDAIGHNFTKLGIFDSKDLPELLKLFAKAVRGDVEDILEWTIEHKDGTRIPIEASASLVKKDGKIEGVVAIVRNITERKRAEEEKSRSRRLLLGLSEAAPTVQRADTPEAVYQAIGRQLVKMDLDVTVFSLSDDRMHLSIPFLTLDSKLVRAAEKLTGLSAKDYSFALKPDGYFHKIISNGETVYNLLDTAPAREALPRSLRPLASKVLELLGTKQSILAPLTYSGEVQGLLTITGANLSESDIPAISAFANQAAIAIENTRLTREKQEIAAFNESIIQSMTEGITVEDVEGFITFANPAAGDMLGYTTEELVGMHWTYIIPSDQHPIVREADQRRITGTADRYELVQLSKNGARVTSLVSGSPRYDDEGSFIGSLAVFTDITERKQAEEMLREQSDTIRSILDTTQEWIWEIDLEGNHTYSNPAIERILGYPLDEIVGKSSFDLMHEDDSQMIATAMPDWVSEKKGWSDLVIRWKHRDGSWRYLESAAVPINDGSGQIEGFRGVDRDITERRFIEESEREQRLFAEALAETAAAINSTLDVDDVFEGILDGIQRVLHYDAADISLMEGDDSRIVASRGHDEYGSTDIKNKIIPLAQTPYSIRMVETGQPEILDDVRDDPRWTKDGSFNGIGEWIRAYAGAPIVVDDFVVGFIHINSKQTGVYNGKAATWLKAFADQAAVALHNAQMYQKLGEHTEQLEEMVRAATEELRDEKERVETILENSPDAIMLLAPDGTIQITNRGFTNIFGYSNREAEGKSLTFLTQQESVLSVARMLQTIRTPVDTCREELAVQTMDGTLFEVELVLSPINHDGDITGIVCSLRDISALKEVERMKDAFVSNVSHELRTPITSLRLNHDLLMRDPHQREKYLGRMDREITRLNELIEDLLRLSRLDQDNILLSFESVDLNELVATNLEDRRPLSEANQLTMAHIEEPQAPLVHADAKLFPQVLSVLLTNAINYTPAGGHIDVGVTHEVSSGVARAGFYVKDNGVGVARDEVSHLFERFYRGKVGRNSGTSGTGLGLAIASEIVQRHGGEIEVESTGIPGEGTTFTVWIPVIEAEETIEPDEVQHD